MDQITAIDNKLKEIVAKLDDIRDLLIERQKKELSAETGYLNPCSSCPTTTKPKACGCGS